MYILNFYYSRTSTITMDNQFKPQFALWFIYYTENGLWKKIFLMILGMKKEDFGHEFLWKKFHQANSDYEFVYE